MNTVSVIIIAYNNAHHIRDAIESVKKQTFVDWDCTVVDNGSTDDTSRKIVETIQGDGRFQTFSKENEGPSSGRNFGYSKVLAKPIYVHFLDGDDMLHPDFLARMVGYMAENADVGILGCQFDVINDRREHVKPGYRSRIGPGKFGIPTALKPAQKKTPFDCFFAATGQGPFALFRVSVFDQTTGYEPDFWSHEDSDIFCQMALLAEVHYLPDRLYLKRVHDFNLSGSSKMHNSKFRDKWDNYFSEDSAINLKIEQSLKYYYNRHKPIRDFKVAVKSLRKAVRELDLRAFNWSMSCLRAGVLDLFFHKSYRSVMARRTALLR